MFSTDQVDHYEIGAGDRLEIGADGFPDEVDVESGFPEEIEVGAGDYADEEVGAPAPEAVRKVIKAARDNRCPCPPMRAVSADVPEEDDEFSPWFADVAVGVGEAIGAANPFPLTTKLLQRFGAGREKPRYVRVDTEDTYKAFRAESSPEMAAFRETLRDLADRLEAHIHDPNAHAEMLEEVEEYEAIGAAVAGAEGDKEIDLWLPEWAKGKVHAWREGDHICTSIRLPGSDGEVRVCTSMTPVASAEGEMALHAASADVPAGEVVGVLPAMSCVLGAGTLVKEMAAAAPSILRRPEAAGKDSFVCRIEPKASPTLCALVALANECAKGDKQACAEWGALADAAKRGGAEHVAQAMVEARDVLAKAVGKRA